MTLFVGRRQHLALVDIIDLERLQDLRFHEMADACLGHDRNGDGFLDRPDQTGVGHARHPTLLTDVGWYPLQGHDRHRARLLGDLGLFHVNHVHDDPALEHLRQLRVQEISILCHAATRLQCEADMPHRVACPD